MASYKRIGIFGGSFDPPHYGHLILAREAQRAFKLSKVFFVPTYRHPFKKRAWASGRQRMKMVELAIEGDRNFAASDFEIKKKGPSFTYDTLEYFRGLFGTETQLYFLAGFDCLGELAKWKNAGKLKKMARFIGAPRPNTAKPRRRAYAGSVNMPLIDISSSGIRRSIKHSRPVRYMLPDKVLKFIERNRIYK